MADRESPTPQLTPNEKLAEAASKALDNPTTAAPSEAYTTTLSRDSEKTRRRIAYKPRYDAFQEAAELRRQKVCHLVSRNDIWDSGLAKNEREAAECKAKLVELEERNAEMRKARREFNTLFKTDVAGAKEDIGVQREWDAFFELRRKEAPTEKE